MSTKDNDESSISSASASAADAAAGATNGASNAAEAFANDLPDAQVVVENGNGARKPDAAAATTKKIVKRPKSSASSVASGSSANTPSVSTKNSASKKNHGVPYIDYAREAIVGLNDRTGSSQIAIFKYIMDKHPELDVVKLKGRLLATLKSGVANKRFVKFRSSFKINPDYKGKKNSKKASSVVKKAAATTTTSKPEANDALSAKEKERKERIRRRRFPMEDLALIAEDRELRVVPDPLPPRPTSLALAMPEFPIASRSDTVTGGLWEDALFVYHFFRGDMGWARMLENPRKKGQIPLYLVAPFSLSHWIGAVEDILRGNAKKCRMVPPLISHAFVVALQVACKDVFPQLYNALTPGSWSEVLLLYIDAMQRHTTSNESVDNAQHEIQTALPIDTEFLFGTTQTCVPHSSVSENPKSLPFEPCAYISPGTMTKAYDKLFANNDAWMLNADELMSLLRAIVDDLINNRPEIHDELDARLSEVYELLKKKRVADAQYRKLSSTLRRQENGTVSKGEEKNGKKLAPNEVEAARKHQLSVNTAYEKACRFQSAETKPIGYDRNFNAFYNFAHDPGTVFVRLRGPIVKISPKWSIPMDFRAYKTNWHKITNRSTLDAYVESLDVRGERESALAEALQRVRKHLVDDVKELQDKKARAREREDLMRQLDNAKKKCELGRKSGRLAGKADDEFAVVQAQIDKMDDEDKARQQAEEAGVQAVAPVIDWRDATGVGILDSFDNMDVKEQFLVQRKRATRRDAAKQEAEMKQFAEQEDLYTKLKCAQLIPTGGMDGTGIVGLIASDLTDIEQRCQDLAAWPSEMRLGWQSGLELSVSSWHVMNPTLIGPQPENAEEEKKSPEEAALSFQQILGTLRRCLLQLEERIFNDSGLSVASRDLDIAGVEPKEEEDRDAMNVDVDPDQWKKDLCVLRTFKPSSRVRVILIQAIDHARKAGLVDVVADLGSALLLYHPDAPGIAKSAALETLAKNGGYEMSEEELAEQGGKVDEEDDAMDDQEEGKTGYTISLSFEADALNGSLDGYGDAARSDWIEAVKRSKTMAKISSLVSAFVFKASEKLEKMEIGKLNMDEIVKLSSGRRKKKNDEIETEVWADAAYLDEFCWTKVDTFPWWPARKCAANDSRVADALSSMDCELVSMLGEEGGQRVVRTDQIVPYGQGSPDVDSNLSSYSKELRSQLQDCIEMANGLVSKNGKR